MSYEDVEHLIQSLSLKNDKDATKELTRFFVTARFGLGGEDFAHQYTDSDHDGGIDFFNAEDGTFYIIQSKFSRTPRRVSERAVLNELAKIENTLAGKNPNARATDFVNAFRRETADEHSLLEIVWLTTDQVRESTIDHVQQEVEAIRARHSWHLGVDFVPFDKDALERMIFDMAHGYIPYTGKKDLPISAGGDGSKYIENHGGTTRIYSVVCSVKVADVLKWIGKQDDINRFLQKNVREYRGNTKINKGVKNSFLGTPALFWYKHNGIIIFADSIAVHSNKLVMRNPQVVNGGQTLRALYDAYNQTGRKDSDAEVLVRAYRLPYERAETYTKSIDIIEALNSQNPILASDLHSTDPRQVRLQFLFKGLGYQYHRKGGGRGEIKSGAHSITMRNLAFYYYVCRRHAPHEGVAREVERIFEEKSSYDQTFPEDSIRCDLGMSHVVLSYLLVWRLKEILDAFSKDLPKHDRELSVYTKYFVLGDMYHKMVAWRVSGFKGSWRDWRSFIESDQLREGLWDYVKKTFRTASSLLPRGMKDARKFFKNKEATEKFASRMESTRHFNSVLKRAYGAFERAQ